MGQVEPATTDLTVSLVEHTNFAVSDRAGDMHPGRYHGYFVADTRFLSRFALGLNGRPLDTLASGDSPDHASATFYLASPELPGLPAGTISVMRDRVLDHRHLEERIRLISYARDPIDVELSIEVDADFADIFEVRGRHPMPRQVEANRRPRAIRYTYENRGHRETTTIALDRAANAHDGRLAFEARLEHGRPWDLHLRVEPEVSHRRGVPPPLPRPHVGPGRVRQWLEGAPHIETVDRRLERAWGRGVRDLASLLLTGPAEQFIPAAGLPWYLAIFGRDASITAMQSMLLGPDIPHGTLRQLAAYQGTADDPWREEGPGKIPHEVRTGELATLGEIPFGRYYGSADATPLYVQLFVATCRWSGWLAGASANGSGALPPSLAEFLPAVEAALGWIERSVDADGLLWYGPKGDGGIRNQVWKDSNDSMRYADGSIAEPPIAAVEVQGYVVAARNGMADVYDALGRHEEARAQRRAADHLAQLVDDLFWMPEEGTYALGIDAGRREIDGVGSNAGHLLWADAVPRHRAASVAERLLAPDMFSGWGIRTLSSRNPAYNPLGYHIGPVWPHDTSLVANGLARYGHFEAAQRIIDGLLDAADADPAARLPELFAGYDRGTTPDLVPYPTACSPQAWATGAIFLAVRTLLGIPADARQAQWRDLEIEPRDRAEWTIADLATVAART